MRSTPQEFAKPLAVMRTPRASKQLSTDLMSSTVLTVLTAELTIVHKMYPMSNDRGEGESGV